MNSKEKRVVKVIMEYDDGDKIFIEGDDVQIWKNALNDAVFNDQIHGGNLKDILNSIVWSRLGDSLI